jgi:hypothetical protein
MAAPNSYRAKTATFASSAKLGLSSCKVSASGQTTDLVCDAVDSVRAVFVDALVCDVTIASSDLSLLDTIKPGDIGALVLVFEKRAEGRAAAVSGNLTGTLATAVVVSTDIDSGTTGIGSGTVTFRCSAPDGGGAIAWT